MKTYRISQYKKDEFTSKMDKFAKRAAKLGLEFGCNLESTTEESYVLRDGVILQNITSLLANDLQVFYTVHHYSVYGDSPVINGYTFLAKAEPLQEGVNLIHSHNTEYDFTNYRSMALTCEHCNINRFRIFYYLIQNESDESVKMVGHNCLANYISQPNAESIASFYNDLLMDSEESRDDISEDYIKHTDSVFSLDSFLSYAFQVVEIKGYISAKNEDLQTGILSTKTLTCNEYFGYNKMIITDETKEAVKKIIETVKDELTKKINLNEYENNILRLIEANRMKINHAGYVVSIIPLYNRLTDVTSQATESQYIGEIGQKMESIKAVVTYYNNIPTQYGITHLYKFNSDNNVITYFSSNDLNLNVNDDVIITKATVKTHDMYNNVRQTVITRGKIQLLAK